MFVNCTNHPYDMWGDAQRSAAEKYGEVVDLPFPSVDPLLGTDYIRRLVDDYARRIEALHAQAVLVAGEFSFMFMLVDKLLSDGEHVVCACSRRKTTEVRRPDGTNRSDDRTARTRRRRCLCSNGSVRTNTMRTARTRR